MHIELLPTAIDQQIPAGPWLAFLAGVVHTYAPARKKGLF